MLRFTSYDIVFQEIPDEVTLALNISNCPNRCKGCHSRHLWEDVGEELNKPSLNALLGRYGNAVTCVCFMGGDASPEEVEALSVYIRELGGGKWKTGWYSGKSELPANCSAANFNYIKLGPYVEHLGGLDSNTTNQRFYCVKEGGALLDLTSRFRQDKKEYMRHLD